MPEETLFELPEAISAKTEVPTNTRPEVARLFRPVRSQVEWGTKHLDSLIPADHQARAIWAILEKLDLSAFYTAVKAVVGHPGHPTSDPMVLLALWLLGTAEGIGSARHLARLCEEHDAYRWIRGGVPVNYHMLADFRVANKAALDKLLTEILASMMHAGLVNLQHVAHDGMRIRASAGASSFRRKESLEKCFEEAQNHVAELAKQSEQPDPKLTSKQEAAREHAAKDRLERVEEAIKRLPEIQAIKDRQRKKYEKSRAAKVTEPRTSTTDADATIMKMPDGGFRPAYNAQLATEVHSQIIVGVDVVTVGSDGGQAMPMVEKIIERTGKTPQAYLADGGFAKRDDITALEKKGITVYAPTTPPQTKTSGRSEADPRPDDTPEVGAWRARMQTEEGKTIYKERAATAECVNAQARAHGLYQLKVRGLAKTLSVLLLAAITHNVLRWITLASTAA